MIIVFTSCSRVRYPDAVENSQYRGPLAPAGYRNGTGDRAPGGAVWGLGYGTIVSYSCLDGRRFEDGLVTKDVSCVGRGVWNETGLSCECGWNF